MGRNFISCALPTLMLLCQMTQSSAAQDTSVLAAQSAMLQSSGHTEIMRAAASVCLLHPTDRKAILEKLDHAGWTIGGDAEWIEADHSDAWVTLMGSNEDFFCDVQGDISQAAALAQVKNLLSAVNWQGWTITREDRECHSLSHPDGIGIYITSSGNDPVCTPTPHSAIRISADRN